MEDISPNDIIWIKNVYNKVTEAAYMDKESEFILHFPPGVGKNVSSPKAGEIILLYQTMKKQKVLTHLVTPIDNEKVKDGEWWGRRVKIIAKTTIPVSSTLWKNVRFGGFSTGNACEIGKILSVKNHEDLLWDVWNKFEPFFTDSYIDSKCRIDSIKMEAADELEKEGVKEGDEKVVRHILRERNRDIVIKKKQEAIKKGCLRCEICGFSFIDKFGKEFIECHHKTPISQTGSGTKTKLEDLGLVCANCHRMLHSKFKGKYLKMEELKALLK